MEENKEQEMLSKRQQLTRILQAVSPEADFGDDEALFGRILDDYADYAELLERHPREVAEAELRGRNARIDELMAERHPLTDGLPHLSSRRAPAPMQSLFEVAGG